MTPRVVRSSVKPDMGQANVHAKRAVQHVDTRWSAPVGRGPIDMTFVGHLATAHARSSHDRHTYDEVSPCDAPVRRR